jgi:hypothetical protein
MANLQYAIHTALANKGEDEKRAADLILKGDSNRQLREALKKERVKGAHMFATLMEGGLANVDKDVPQFKPFNKKKPPCSQEEFDRQLKSIMRNFPRFEGRCAEFRYFLNELEALRNTANITDDQLVRVLQNRLAGRLQRYFSNEMNRDKNNVVEVINRLGRDYVETIDVAAEIEKCATFKFQFKNIADELIKLKEIMSLAYPHMPTAMLLQAYIQKVTDKLPSEVRLALVDDFERQRAREELGFPPLTSSEIDAKIIRYCRNLERKQLNKPVYKVEVKSSLPSYTESERSDSDSGFNSHERIRTRKTSKNEIKNFIKSVKQIAEQAAKQTGENQAMQREKENKREPPKAPFVPRNAFRNNEPKFQKTVFPQRNSQQPGRPQNRFEKQPRFFQPRNSDFARPNAQRRWQGGPNGRQPKNQWEVPPRMMGKERPQVHLANPRDPHYLAWVKEAKEGNQVRYLGQQIRHDFQNASPNFKEILKQTREPDSPYDNSAFYVWKHGKYSVENNPEINYPVMRKVGNGIPQLSSEIMKRFNRCCYACGDPGCPRKGRKARFECAYQTKADSWMPCENCMRGFHLKKDCLANIKN